MNPHIEKLKERLAAGEISIEEFKTLSTVLSDVQTETKKRAIPILELKCKMGTLIVIR